MWLWLTLCLASTVIAQNDIIASGTTESSKKSGSVNGEVLLKIWTIFADLLDADGKTVKIPSRDHVQFALTLIKKTLLENTDSTNVDLNEKLFLREAELAKYKKVYIHDSRPLQTLLDLELIPDQKSNVMFKYELRANDSPKCKRAFEELIQKLHQNYNNLANSPVCSEGPINLQPEQNSLYNPEDANQYAQLNANIEPTINNIENTAATLNRNNNIGGLIQNPNSLRYQGEIKEVIGAAQIPTLNTNEENNLLHAVKLSKDTHSFIGNDYTADLEHAKNVADRINAMYQSSNTLPSPIDPSLYPKEPLRELNTNMAAVNIETQNNPWSLSQYSRPILQSGYVTQNQVNPLNNGWNQSYTIITNTMQAQPPVKNTIVNQEYTNPLNTFVNSKYHPNLDHDDESTKKELPINAPIANIENIQPTNIAPSNKKLSYIFHSQPNQVKEQSTEIPPQQNIAQYAYKNPTIGNAVLSDKQNNNYLNYNIYSYLKPKYQNFLPNSYAYKPGYNPYGLKLIYNNPYQYNSQASTLRHNYTRGYNYVFQQSFAQPQGSLITMKYLNQKPNTIHGQKFVQSVPPPFQTYKVNMQSNPIQNYGYGMTHIQTNVPQFTHTTTYYNGQPVINKLADWVSGTNSAKLNSDNDNSEVELTYLVKKPPPIYHPTMYFVKFRMPYKSFANHINELVKPQTLRTASPDTALYMNLAAQYNATVIPSEVSAVPEDVKTKDDKLLVRARYIQPNEPGKKNPNSVDIINLVKEPELNHANLGNPLNTVSNNAQIPIL